MAAESELEAARLAGQEQRAAIGRMECRLAVARQAAADAGAKLQARCSFSRPAHIMSQAKSSSTAFGPDFLRNSPGGSDAPPMVCSTGLR